MDSTEPFNMSRFSCLNIDDAGDPMPEPSPRRTPRNTQPTDNPQNSKRAIKKTKSAAKKMDSGSPSPRLNTVDGGAKRPTHPKNAKSKKSQSVAKKAPRRKNKTPKPISFEPQQEREYAYHEQQQWVDWTKKDNDIVNTLFEQDIETATELSTQEYYGKYFQDLAKSEVRRDTQPEIDEPVPSTSRASDDQPSTSRVSGYQMAEEIHDTCHRILHEQLLIEQDKLLKEKIKNNDLRAEIELMTTELNYLNTKNQILTRMLTNARDKSYDELITEYHTSCAERNLLTRERASRQLLIDMEQEKLRVLQAKRAEKEKEEAVKPTKKQ